MAAAAAWDHSGPTPTRPSCPPASPSPGEPAPGTPVTRLAGQDQSSPAKRRRLRSAATTCRLWGRSRWLHFYEEELLQVKVGGQQAPTEPAKQLANEVTARATVAAVEQAPAAGENLSWRDVEAFAMENVKRIGHEFSQEYEKRLADKFEECRRLKEKLAESLEESQRLNGSNDQLMEVNALLMDKCARLEEQVAAERNRREEIDELEEWAKRFENEEIAALRASLAMCKRDLEWANRKLYEELGSAMGGPIVGYDSCAKCGCLLDKEYGRLNDSDGDSDTTERWICSCCCKYEDHLNDSNSASADSGCASGGDSAAPLTVGCPVELHGLVGRRELNGRRGQVTTYVKQTDRHGVKLEGAANFSDMAVKRANLRRVLWVPFA